MAFSTLAHPVNEPTRFWAKQLIVTQLTRECNLRCAELNSFNFSKSVWWRRSVPDCCAELHPSRMTTIYPPVFQRFQRTITMNSKMAASNFFYCVVLVLHTPKRAHLLPSGRAFDGHLACSITRQCFCFLVCCTSNFYYFYCISTAYTKASPPVAVR